MYIPHYFKNKNLDEVKEFLSRNSFGILINSIDSKLWATHIPLELEKNKEGQDVLVGHISKSNPQWKNFTKNEEVLAIFQGPNSYISSAWYKDENVPTWNYIAVHVYGKVKTIEGDELLESLKKLVGKYEKDSANPVSVDRMSKETLKQINGIVAFEIIIHEIQAAYKLSQNRNEDDYNNIINKLQNRNNPNSKMIAKEMIKIKVSNPFQK